MTRTSARKSAAKSAHRSRRKTSRHKSARSASRGRRWSARVTRESDALDLDRGVFTERDPKRIAASLKRSAERSRRRKADPYRSALSMLTFCHQSRRQELAGQPAQNPATCQSRIA
ncbi:MAG: DUF3175 domain-containing protein [Xanthobacteraceae bacterium]